MKYLIKNGRVIDPANSIDDSLDILVSDGKIDRIGKKIDVKADETIDAAGKIVAAGLVDMHTHLREPGREDKETVATGTRAAVKGGFTTIACMSNTEPPIDDAKVVRLLKDIIKRDALSEVLIVGAITENRFGRKLTDFKAMKKEGIIAVSDDGSSVDNEKLMCDALKEAKKTHLLLIDHCEDLRLSGRGVMNQGFIATKMGLRGMPAESEYERVKRDVALATKMSARIHIAHVSCRESVEIIRRAKKKGIKVTAETAPHYFALTEDCCVTYDTNTKMNPPLRTKEDVIAIKEGLKDGTIDVIATDHAPHTDSEKDVEFDFAPFGIIGLETALSLAVMELVDKKVLSWNELILKMSVNPSRILGIDRGALKEGGTANIVVIDPDEKYIYKKDTIESRSRNSPFIDWELKGRAKIVFVGGNPVMK
ncbi:MAG: dihydroorotase [Candidatus Omnitrophica bacterium]|nr:dihydroorotase [Candidatus Omnitrophota bacterium]